MTMPARPDEAAEEALIALSALQHYLFCPRQCALIHIEQLWADDGATVEGQILHERVDDGRTTHRDAVRVVRGLTLRSFVLGVIGRADVVEFRGSPARPFPVEYKRGRPKKHRADEVQLCAQAICLEEAFNCQISEGALFYGTTRRRLPVRFDAELRHLTAETAAAARSMIQAGCTPPPVYRPAACGRCSLEALCQPKRLSTPPAVGRWLAKQIEG